MESLYEHTARQPEAAVPAKKVFRLLDGLRGIAALVVVLLHIPQFIKDDTFPEGYLAVDLFFVISGVVIRQAYEHRLESELSVWRFAWLRIVRLYPLYMLGAMISFTATCPNIYCLQLLCCPIPASECEPFTP